MSSNLLSTYDDPQSRKLEGFLGDPMSYKPFDTMIVKDSAHNALQREFPICKSSLSILYQRLFETFHLFPVGVD